MMYKVKSIILVLLMMGSCSAHYGEDCLTVCQDVNPLDEWEEEGYAPKLYMLKKLCPKTLKFLDCRIKEMQRCLGHSFADLSVSSNFSVATFSRVILATDNLIRQVCDQNSSFHKDYIQNVGCYKAYFYVIQKFCNEDATRLLVSFSNKMKDTPREHLSCKEKLFFGPYELTCTTDLVGRACGPTARRLHASASLMFKDIFMVDCPYVDPSWKDEYVDFLVGNKKREFEEIYHTFFENIWSFSTRQYSKMYAL